MRNEKLIQLRKFYRNTFSNYLTWTFIYIILVWSFFLIRKIPGYLDVFFYINDLVAEKFMPPFNSYREIFKFLQVAEIVLFILIPGIFVLAIKPKTLSINNRFYNEIYFILYSSGLKVNKKKIEKENSLKSYNLLDVYRILSENGLVTQMYICNDKDMNDIKKGSFILSLVDNRYMAHKVVKTKNGRFIIRDMFGFKSKNNLEDLESLQGKWIDDNKGLLVVVPEGLNLDIKENVIDESVF